MGNLLLRSRCFCRQLFFFHWKTCLNYDMTTLTQQNNYISMINEWLQNDFELIKQFLCVEATARLDHGTSVSISTRVWSRTQPMTSAGSAQIWLPSRFPVSHLLRPPHLFQSAVHSPDVNSATKWPLASLSGRFISLRSCHWQINVKVKNAVAEVQLLTFYRPLHRTILVVFIFFRIIFWVVCA